MGMYVNIVEQNVEISKTRKMTNQNFAYGQTVTEFYIGLLFRKDIMNEV